MVLRQAVIVGLVQMPTPEKSHAESTALMLHAVGPARRVAGGDVMVALRLGPDVRIVRASLSIWAALARRALFEAEACPGRPPLHGVGVLDVVQPVPGETPGAPSNAQPA